MSTAIEVIEPEVVGKQLAEVEHSSGLAEDTAIALRGQFSDYYNAIVDWREKAAMVTKPEDATHQKIAREVRLGLRKVRCEVENIRKALKADSLARGKAIDGFANILKYLCEPVEEQLLAIEQFAERQEAARIAALVEERTAALLAVEADPAAYNLGLMSDEVWTGLLHACTQTKADKDRLAAQAEADRIAREQADRIAREQAEADAAAARAEADKQRKAREAVEAKAKAEREAAAKKERDAKAASDAALAKEREAREKAEADAAAAKKAEAGRIAAEAAAAEARAKAERDADAKAARAPDRERVMAFAAAVRRLAVPQSKTEAGAVVCATVAAKVEQFAQWIEKQAASL